MRTAILVGILVALAAAQPFPGYLPIGLPQACPPTVNPNAGKVVWPTAAQACNGSVAKATPQPRDAYEDYNGCVAWFTLPKPTGGGQLLANAQAYCRDFGAIYGIGLLYGTCVDPCTGDALPGAANCDLCATISAAGYRRNPTFPEEPSGTGYYRKRHARSRPYMGQRGGMGMATAAPTPKPSPTPTVSACNTTNLVKDCFTYFCSAYAQEQCREWFPTLCNADYQGWNSFISPVTNDVVNSDYNYNIGYHMDCFGPIISPTSGIAGANALLASRIILARTQVRVFSSTPQGCDVARFIPVGV